MYTSYSSYSSYTSYTSYTFYTLYTSRSTTKCTHYSDKEFKYNLYMKNIVRSETVPIYIKVKKIRATTKRRILR